MNHAIVIQLLVSGVAMGFVYALVAIEYTLIWNACGLLNFAHGGIIQLGAYVFVGTCIGQLGLANEPSALLAIVMLGIFALFIAAIIFIPLRNRSRLIAIVATVMLSEVMSETEIVTWGALALRPRNFLSGVSKVFGATISNNYLYIIGISIVVIILLQFMLQRTKAGKAMTCVSLNKTAASLMGINVKMSIALTIVISFAICAIIGIVMSPLYTVYDGMAEMISLKGFCAGVIGGFGNLPAAIAGGLLVGILENIASIALPSVYKDVVAFAIMILFLLFSPGGVVGIRKNIGKRIRKRRLNRNAL